MVYYSDDIIDMIYKEVPYIKENYDKETIKKFVDYTFLDIRRRIENCEFDKLYIKRIGHLKPDRSYIHKNFRFINKSIEKGYISKEKGDLFLEKYREFIEKDDKLRKEKSKTKK